jgi:predicted transcriptional regulator
MVNFACKDIDILNVVKCSLGLSKGEVSILKYFVKNSPVYFSTDEISRLLKFEQSTVQKCVKKLYEQKILIKKQRNLMNGGYEFEYCSIEISEVRSIIMKNINNWVSRIEKNLCNFE